MNAFGQENGVYFKTPIWTFPNGGAIVIEDSNGQFLTVGSCVQIVPNVILTAGHINKDIFKMILGDSFTDCKAYVTFEANCKTERNRVYFDLSNLKQHPDYIKSQKDGPAVPFEVPDIGLLILKPMNTTEKAKALKEVKRYFEKLNMLSENINKEGVFQLISYGLNHVPKKGSPRLPLPIKGDRYMTKMQYRSQDKVYFEMEYDLAKGFGKTAAGDSGGPLMMQWKKDDFLVVGLVSRSSSDPESGGFFTRLDRKKVQKWILKMIEG